MITLAARGDAALKIRLLILLVLSMSLHGAANAQDTKDNLKADPSAKEYKAQQIKPDWDAVRASKQKGQVASIEALQRGLKAQAARGKNDEKLAQDIEKLFLWTRYADAVDAPVMIPTDFQRFAKSSMNHGDTYYAFNASNSPQDWVSVLGMCSGIQLPEDHPIVKRIRGRNQDAPKLSGLGVPYKVQSSSQGLVLNFSKFNCAYEITMSCSAMCDNQIPQITQLADSMTVLNND